MRRAVVATAAVLVAATSIGGWRVMSRHGSSPATVTAVAAQTLPATPEADATPAPPAQSPFPVRGGAILADDSIYATDSTYPPPWPAPPATIVRLSLTDGRVRQTIAELGLRLVSYADYLAADPARPR